MKEEITYSKSLYRKVMKIKKRANGVLIVVTVVYFIILRIIHLQTPEFIIQNQLLAEQLFLQPVFHQQCTKPTDGIAIRHLIAGIYSAKI